MLCKLFRHVSVTASANWHVMCRLDVQVTVSRFVQRGVYLLFHRLTLSLIGHPLVDDFTKTNTNWVDWLRATGMTESIQFIRKLTSKTATDWTQDDLIFLSGIVGSNISDGAPVAWGLVLSWWDQLVASGAITLLYGCHNTIVGWHNTIVIIESFLVLWS